MDKSSDLLVEQFVLMHGAEASKYKTRHAHAYSPIDKACDGAEKVILFVTTDEIEGNRLYSLRAAVQTQGGIVFAIPEGYEVGSLGTRKACSLKFAKLKRPDIYYGWESGKLFPKYNYSTESTEEESSPKAPEAPKSKGGRPRNLPATAHWSSEDPGSGIKIGGLTYNVDIDWPYFLRTKKVRMPREPVATIERLNEERPETEKLRRMRLKALHKEGHIENPSEYGAYLDPVTDEEFEASMIEVEERLRKEGMERETKAPRITPNHPAGANLIRMATIKVQDQTFKYIGEVMEYLDRMGLQDFTEAQMLEVLDAKGIRIER